MSHEYELSFDLNNLRAVIGLSLAEPPPNLQDLFETEGQPVTALALAVEHACKDGHEATGVFLSFQVLAHLAAAIELHTRAWPDATQARFRSQVDQAVCALREQRQRDQ